MHEQTHYAVYDDGGTGVLTIGALDAASAGEPVLNRPGRLVTQAEYEAVQASLAAGRERRVTQVQEADRERLAADYRALTALGVPTETARRLTGFTAAVEAET